MSKRSAMRAGHRQHRMENPQQTWAQGRIDELLADVPKPASEATLTRGDIMRTITEIEAALTHEPEGERHA